MDVKVVPHFNGGARGADREEPAAIGAPTACRGPRWRERKAGIGSRGKNGRRASTYGLEEWEGPATLSPTLGTGYG